VFEDAREYSALYKAIVKYKPLGSIINVFKDARKCSALYKVRDKIFNSTKSIPKIGVI